MNRLSSFRAGLCALTAAAVLLVTPAATAAGTERAPGADQEDAAGPAPRLSTIGGELLGRTGTQVLPRPGAPELPELTSRAWIVADADTGEVLAARDAHRRLAPASTLKMLFAETVLPKLDPEETYRAEPEHFLDLGAGSSAVGVAPGYSYSVHDLWHGVFLASGNDAVYALTAMNGGKEKTVREMNERAAELQALDTRVVNPDGYDGKGQVSSAYDLTLIARAGMRNERFREYAATDRFAFPGAESGKGKKRKREYYEIQSTNRLLIGAQGLTPYEGIMGVKNGYTSKAGYTFTGAAERDGRLLLVTCMDPEGDGLTVYREAATLLDWGFAAAGRVEPVGELVPTATEAAQAQAEAEAAAESAKNGEGTAGEVVAAGSGGGSGPVPLVAVSATVLALLVAAGYLILRRRPRPAGWVARRPLPGGSPARLLPRRLLPRRVLRRRLLPSRPLPRRPSRPGRPRRNGPAG